MLGYNDFIYRLHSLTAFLTSSIPKVSLLEPYQRNRTLISTLKQGTRIANNPLSNFALIAKFSNLLQLLALLLFATFQKS